MPARYDLSNPANQVKLDKVEELSVLAEEAGLSLVHLALAFVLQHPAVTAPIVGASKPGHLDDAIASLDVELTDEEVGRLEAGYSPRENTGFV